MDNAYLERFRQTALAIDTYLNRTYRDITSPGCGPELDAILSQLFRQQSTGTYVDIGANDPIQISNTWNLYNQTWTGLLIEPDPLCWQRLLKHRPGDKLWPGAASNKAGEALLRASASGVSSLEPDWLCPDDSRHVIVDLLPTRDILQMFSGIRNECDLCSIDVEGHEKAVLEGIDFDTFKPRVFVVESLRYDPAGPPQQLHEEWEPILFENGYELYRETRDKMNRVYTQGRR